MIELHMDSGEMAGVLSIEKKLEVVQMLKTSWQKVIAEKCGVRKSTVVATKKNEARLLAFKSSTINMGMSRQAKVMRLGDSTQLDKAVYLWFKQKRMDGIPVRGPILC